MSKSARIHSLGEEYSESSLRKYFENKSLSPNIEIEDINIVINSFNNTLLESSAESKTAIEKSTLQVKGKVYTEYQKTRYMEIKRYYQFKSQLEYLEEHNIRSFEEMEKQISSKRKEIKYKNADLKKYKETSNKILGDTEKAQDYIKLYETYQYAIFYKEQDNDYTLPEEVNIFLKLQKELNIKSVEEARQLIKLSRSSRIQINKMKKEILELQKNLNHLDTIKEEQMSKSNLYIHSIKFGGNRIDYSKSDDDYWYVDLPYTNENIRIEKRFTAYNEKLKTYTLYLIDDKKYILYDNKGNVIKSIIGKELETYISDKKKENDNKYSKHEIDV
jgi:hypothetical protein